MKIIKSKSQLQNTTFSGLFVGHNLIKLKEVDSTNTFLKDALSKSTPLLEGTVIMAERQFAGRGQAGNSWISEAGLNLTFSILLNPAFLGVENQFQLNKALSLGVSDMLLRYMGQDVFIKWPNDIYISNKKAAGMLIENVVSGNMIRHTIAGIGVNVNQIHFPPELKNVTSLKEALHQDYDLITLLGEICNSVEARYLQLKAKMTDRIDTDYLNRLYLKDTWANFRSGDRYFDGKISGVTAHGQLEMLTGEGTAYFSNKEIEFVND